MQRKLFDDFIDFPGRETAKGVELFLKVSPRSSKNKIGSIINDGQGKFRLRVYINAQPEKNQANMALVIFLSNFFHTSQSSLQIIAGEHSKQKTLLFCGYTMKEIKSFLP